MRLRRQEKDGPTTIPSLGSRAVKSAIRTLDQASHRIGSIGPTGEPIQNGHLALRCKSEDGAVKVDDIDSLRSVERAILTPDHGRVRASSGRRIVGVEDGEFAVRGDLEDRAVRATIEIAVQARR